MNYAPDIQTLRIETPRLILRPLMVEDLDGMAAFHADAEAMRHIGGASGRAVAWRALMTMAGSWALHGFAMFSVIEKSSGDWVGRCGPWRPEDWPGTEVGWGLRREYWGKGYALESAIASIDWAVESLGWTDIIHTIAPDNAPSIALARRLGSVNRGPGRVPPPHQDVRVDIWGQTAEEWRQNRERLMARPTL